MMKVQMTLPGVEAPAPEVGPAWRDDLPSVCGWYRSRRWGSDTWATKYEGRRFFNGTWSELVLVGHDDDHETRLSAMTPAAEQLGIQWQGLEEPHPHGYTYALVLLGPFMTCPMVDALKNLP